VNQIFSNFKFRIIKIQNFQILIQKITFTLENSHLEVIWGHKSEFDGHVIVVTSLFFGWAPPSGWKSYT